MTLSQSNKPYSTTLRAGKQGAQCIVEQQAVLDKSATGEENENGVVKYEKDNHLLKCKTTFGYHPQR